MRRTQLADHPLVGPINPAGVLIRASDRNLVFVSGRLSGRGGAQIQTPQTHIVVAPVLTEMMHFTT